MLKHISVREHHGQHRLAVSDRVDQYLLNNHAAARTYSVFLFILTKLFLKVLIAAFGFPDTGGRIIIRMERRWKGNSPQHFIFTVEDNGIGITQEERHNLFNKFYQIDTSASRKHGGTGLGLAICRGIVEAHGGKIWIDDNYTNGAAFKFTLPANQ